MTLKSLFINVSPGETRIALKEDDRLNTLDIERHSSRSLVGNIYLGRVQKVVGGIQAAFVDIGQDRSGFLALPELRPETKGSDNTNDQIKDYVREGDSVVVQVLRDAIAEKGAKLTTHIKLTGRYVILTPMNNRVRLSRRLDEDQCKRLEAIFNDYIKVDDGAIVRTAAGSVPDDVLIDELRSLRSDWHAVQEKASEATPPCCLFTELPPALRTIRSIADYHISDIVIDDALKFSEVQAFCEQNFPHLVEKIKHHTNSDPLFEAYDIEEEIERALSKIVQLFNGARISIEETAALTAIDIDTAGVSISGRTDETALEANLAAAEEIARQIRLRNIGGHVVIDAVPMRNSKHREQLLSTLRQLFQYDSTPTYIAGYTRLGKIELSRQRQQKSLSEMMLSRGDKADGQQFKKTSASIAFEALRRVLQEMKTNPGKTFELKASSSVVASLQSGVAEQGLNELNEALGAPLKLAEQPDDADDQYDVIVH